jgi:rubredoxin
MGKRDKIENNNCSYLRLTDTGNLSEDGCLCPECGNSELFEDIQISCPGCGWTDIPVEYLSDEPA